MSSNNTEERIVQPSHLARWRTVAVAALIVLGALLACNKVWTFDAFWHLKSGQWMWENSQILRHDPFSVPENGDAPQRWVNVHWLFQCLAAGVHWLGGFAGLVVWKMGVLAGVMAVLAVGLRKRVGPACLMLVGLAIMLGIERRVRVRPEAVTFLLLAATLVLVESVRRGASTRRLWWLTPITVVWVNMHGVYIVGLMAAWAAFGGAWLDRLAKRDTAGNLATRRALPAMIACTAAPLLITPWPVAAALHPLVLMTRLAGEKSFYSFGVQELRPTYLMSPFSTAPLTIALVLAVAAVAMILAVAVAETARGDRRSVAAGHLGWLAMFGVLAVLAVRNVALFVIPAGFLLAIYAGRYGLLMARPDRRRAAVALAARIVMLLVFATTGIAYATEAVYRWQRREGNRFGFGLNEDIHPIRMAKWLGRSELTGDILPLNFGNGGTFIYYSSPRRKVWMDGRLEVHSFERFARLYDYRMKLLSSRQANDPQQTPLPPTVRFIVVEAGDTKRIEALSEAARFRLVYVDRTAVCFARTDFDEAALPPANLREFDRPLAPAGRADLLDVATSRAWWRQNVPPAHWKMGTILYYMGFDRLAARYYAAADRLALVEPVLRLGMLARAHLRLAEYESIDPGMDLPVDPNLTRALALCEEMDLSDLADENAQTFALVKIRALIFGRQIDAADRAMADYLDHLPIPRRWNPPADALALRDAITVAYDRSRRRRKEFDLTGMDPAMRALLLLRRNVGLIDRAIAELRAQTDPPRQAQLLLGDLYLRKGQVAKARQTYDGAPEGSRWDIRMRLGLCDWAGGDFAGAIAKLTEAARDNPKSPAPALYLSLLREQLGDYPAAADALRAYRGGDAPDAERVHRQLAKVAARLKIRGVDVPPLGGAPAKPAG